MSRLPPCVTVKRLICFTLLLAVLALLGSVAWRLTGLPPVEFVLRYGLPHGCEPTGETVKIEGVAFVQIGQGSGAGIARLLRVPGCYAASVGHAEGV